jgi:AraC family transcriptional regulator
VGVAVYLDDSGEMARTECAVSVADEVVGDDEVKVRTLAGGRYAVLRHSSPYARLSDSYAALFAWLEGGGGTRGEGPIVEVYLNDPHDTAPADLETEIRLPLA